MQRAAISGCSESRREPCRIRDKGGVVVGGVGCPPQKRKKITVQTAVLAVLFLLLLLRERRDEIGSASSESL